VYVGKKRGNPLDGELRGDGGFILVDWGGRHI
jgi:hypothetical protein